MSPEPEFAKFVALVDEGRVTDEAPGPESTIRWCEGFPRRIGLPWKRSKQFVEQPTYFFKVGSILVAYYVQ